MKLRRCYDNCECTAYHNRSWDRIKDQNLQNSLQLEMVVGAEQLPGHTAYSLCTDHA